MYTNTKAMAVLVSDAMVGAVDANRKAFIEMDEYESIFESWFDLLCEQHIPQWAYERTYNEVEKSDEVQLAYTVIKSIIEDTRIEAEYALDVAANPSKYYGSVHDYH